VLGTGNHYVLDVAGSIALLTAAVLAARVAGSRRDECAPISVVR
jgi:hypothetical protein